MHKQRGIVLFIVIMTLPLLMILGFMVMQNTSSGLKMADARGSLDTSNMTLLAASSEILAYKDSGTTTDVTILQHLILKKGSDPQSLILFPDVKAKIFKISEPIPCKRSKNAFDNGRFKCRYLSVQLTHDFGRQINGKKWGSNMLEVGIEQKIKH
ncbi:type IV pilus assembly protein PilX [Psychromonas sp. CNPT3]|uniref:pilus assembly PilX family protein n=1 Tax=Psychromonas sp. CNPT3 TaxID=314282 RepID=UPI00006E7646|nr:pilus assembly protein PilX [Psychromonas sp. CNPT3]AGH80360.1 type IV pilus assembly protein PilX [Psychromonas sp. CNPT3]